MDKLLIFLSSVASNEKSQHSNTGKPAPEPDSLSIGCVAWLIKICSHILKFRSHVSRTVLPAGYGRAPGVQSDSLPERAQLKNLFTHSKNKR